MVDFVDLAALKDDLGITGSADDAWLARRVAGALAAFESYTHRYIGPVATFEDDFTRIVRDGGSFVAPPDIRSPFVPARLTAIPVASIVSATNNGTAISPASNVLFDPPSGRIFSLDGSRISELGRALAGLVVRYTAGFATLPADLYEALVGIIRNQYAVRSSGTAGASIGGFGIKSVQVPDVGSVTLGGSSSTFEAAASVAGDPLLGPWAAALDPYFRPATADHWAPASRLVSTP